MSRHTTARRLAVLLALPGWLMTGIVQAAPPDGDDGEGDGGRALDAPPLDSLETPDTTGDDRDVFDDAGSSEDSAELDEDLPDFDAIDEAAEAAAFAAQLEQSSGADSRTRTTKANTSKSRTSKSASAKTSARGGKKPSGSKASPAAPPEPPLPARDERCAYRTPIWEHVVAPGEHIGGIAGRYGVLRRDLLALNPDVTNPDRIRIGQRLLVCPEIPPQATKVVVHEVAAGESLSKIAKLYGLTLDELRAQLPKPSEGQGDPNLLRIGTRIELTLDDGIVRGFRPDDLVRKPESVAHVDVAPNVVATARLPEGLGYRIKRPHLAFGSERTVALLVEVFERYRRHAKGGPLINVGDISRKGGGRLKGHRSHRRGVDVDIGLVLKGEDANVARFLNATPDNLDVRRTWLLVRELLETGEVRYIFLDYRVQAQLYEYALEHGVEERQLDEWFQYPRGIGRNHGIVRHWRNHRNHLHVRFR